MDNLYTTLCMVRTSMLNAITSKYIFGTTCNIKVLLENIANEIDTYVDIIADIKNNLSEEELLDLGFSYFNIDESDLMLFPIWLYAFISDGAILVDINHDIVVKGQYDIEIYNDHWINVGFLCSDDRSYYG